MFVFCIYVCFLYIAVIKAKVIDTNFRPTNNKFSSLPVFFQPKYIQVELRKIFKGKAAINAKKYETVNIRYGSMDRVNLEVGHLYILTGYTIGSTPFMNLCSWKAKMKDLSLAQKFGINRVYYWLYCRCRITHCKGRFCQQDRRTCFWDQGNPDCHSKNKICMVKGGAKCEWVGPTNRTC